MNPYDLSWLLTSQSIQPFQIVTTVIITAIALNTALPELCKILGWNREIAIDGSKKINYEVRLFAKE
ncbi:hypothetical protein SAMN05878482_105219 [Peribacillus simplex]|uniref:Uncharacterized protein n=1 Tax=Peribacillus simplex TaxID=1478 RepID=A0A9X8RB86_9BACI|nr:hypothetical protein SAMN05878482_105219 [Peribacillus simplex]